MCRRYVCTEWSPSATYTVEVHYSPIWLKRHRRGKSFWVFCHHQCVPKLIAAPCVAVGGSYCYWHC